MHNELGVTNTMPVKVTDFHNRSIKVIHGDTFSNEIIKRINSKTLTAIKLRIGSINQFIDSTDVLCWNEARKELASIYMIV